VVAVPAGVRRLPASDVEGSDLDGRPLALRLASAGHWTLLLFLGSRCDGCLPFWTPPPTAAACGLEPQDAVVVVTRGPGDEEVGAIAAIVGRRPVDAPGLVIMSDAAWRSYRVLGPPFFVLVDGVEVVTEGVAWTVEQLAADVARARRPRPGRHAAARA
jgi:hypothetical protein